MRGDYEWCCHEIRWVRYQLRTGFAYICELQYLNTLAVNYPQAYNAALESVGGAV